MKLCECGCGCPAPIARRNDRTKGWVKGQPVRFLPGHNRRHVAYVPINSSGLCECGCGNRTTLATKTSIARGRVKGQPLRYLPGHAQRKLKQHQGDSPNPSGLCVCGCGQKVPLALKTCARTGLIQGQPVRYIHGHALLKKVPSPPNPSGFCMCGCGGRTNLASRNIHSDGLVKGQPVRFIVGHNGRKPDMPAEAEKTCPKCLKTLPATTEFFYANKTAKSGLAATCRTCFTAAVITRNRLNPERTAARFRAYCLAHPGRNTAAWAKRKARQLGCGGTHTPDDIRAQHERQKGRCFYCHKKLKKYHREHVVPLALGGSNGPENIVIACPECNLSKGSKHPMDFCGRLL